MDPRAGDSPEHLAARLAEVEARLAQVDSKPATLVPLVERLMRYLPLIALGNIFVAAPAFLISIGVAYFTFVQADATEKMQIASVWPHVGYETSNIAEDGSKLITLSLYNKGVGPAMVRGIQVRRDGTAYETLDELLEDCCASETGALPYGIGSVHGEVLRPGEQLMFAQLSREGTPDDVWESFDLARLQLEVEVCFCSVFDDCFISRTQAFDPEPVEQCPAEWTQYYGFQQPLVARP